ncbi:MAG: hypothetical protein ACJ8LG_23195 [Massilia sp.]
MFELFRKPILVLLGAALLSAMIVISPGYTDSMPNRLGLGMGCLPLAIFCASATTYKPWEFGTFFCGIILVIVGIGCFIVEDAFGEFARAGQAARKFSKSDVHFWTYGIEMWKFVLPAISMGIGLNLISTFISSERPVEAASITETTQARDLRQDWRD